MPTIKQLTKEAKKLNIVRAKSTYNGGAYWHYVGESAIITRDQLMKILGY